MKVIISRNQFFFAIVSHCFPLVRLIVLIIKEIDRKLLIVLEK